jgi:DNA-binding transcriptional LysR family regulator
MLDVRRLRVLREVAAHGSFSAAADALSFTQPAVSRQIATLEAEAGTQLVDRGARGIRLTAAGELLVQHANAILDRLAAAETQLEDLARLEGGRVRLGSFPTASATLTPMSVRAFFEEHPRIELRLVEANSPELLDQLRAGGLDIAVISDARPLDDLVEDIELEHLMDDPMYVALSRDHPLADAPELTMADLRDEMWIEGRHRMSIEPLEEAARRAGFEPRVAFESAEWLGKQGLVAAGVGVTLIPTLALATVRDDIVLRNLGAGAPRRRIHLATHACRTHAPAVAPMREILHRVAREHCFTCDAMVA